MASSLGPGLPLTASWALAYRAFAARLLPHQRLFRVEEPLSGVRTRAKSDFSGPAPTRTRACKTVRVTPWPDVVQGSLLEDMEPISPELVLVDPELAERARQVLPEPRRPIRAEPATWVPVAQPAPRRWRRTAVLAALIFAAGAASGELLGRRESSSRSGLEIGPDARPTAESGGATQRTGSDNRTAAPAKRDRRAASRIWAANVLGVTAGVDAKGISLVWKRPSRSDHVVVLRTRGAGSNSVVVFRGRATRYRDASARSCSEYRYKIVNYDRRGHRSTGVLTSVVTPGCA